MNRVRVLGFLVGALAFVALAVPGSALAGAYTWDLGSDFTASPPGANPDHDPYGATPWSYQQGSSTSPDPSTFSLLTDFSAQGGLSAWSGGSTGALVGINTSPQPVPEGPNATVPPGQIFLQPGSSGYPVAVAWTSPLSQTQTISINGTFSADAGGNPNPCIYASSWSVDDQNGHLAGGLVSANPPSSFSISPSVAPGETIYVSVSAPPPADASCSATGLSLQIQANGTAPSPAVTSPSAGSATTLTAPSFAGTATGGFGQSSQVTLRVYSGQTASGTPVQTVTAPRSGGAWSATLASALPLGTYTVQAEQDDVASPPDAGLSAPVTFVIRVPSVALTAFASPLLTTSTPTLLGTADTIGGADPFAVVQVFAGTTATGTPARTLATALSPSGQFSVPVTPALADGTYTAVATQGDSAGTSGSSPPRTFNVDTHPPPVTLVRPAKRSRADWLQLKFTGAAGTFAFDANSVTVSLYRGRKAAGKRVGTAKAKVSGSTWSTSWPRTLAPGVYTARASQSDAAGHVGVSGARTFRVLALPPVIARTVTTDGTGRVSVKVACNEPAGDTCSGTVLVLTRREFQPLSGGPVGRLTVMFAYVHLRGAQISTVRRKLLPSVARVLGHRANVAVTLAANLRPARGKKIHATVEGNLRRVGP